MLHAEMVMDEVDNGSESWKTIRSQDVPLLESA